MSSSMPLRCLLRRIPARQLLPRVGRGVPPTSRPMSTVSQDEVRRVMEMHERSKESIKVRREASIKEGIKMEKEYEENRKLMVASLDDLKRACENMTEVARKRRVAIAGFTSIFVVSVLGYDYYLDSVQARVINMNSLD